MERTKTLNALIVQASLLYDKLEDTLTDLRKLLESNSMTRDILEDSALSVPEKLILISLTVYPRPIRQIDIIRLTKLNPRTVRKHLKLLLILE